MRDEGIDDHIQRSMEEVLQLVNRKPDPVIGNAPLWKIVGSDPLTSVS